VDYGLTTFGDLFTDRQLVALNTFQRSWCMRREHKSRPMRVSAAGLSPTPHPLRDGGNGAKGYAEAVECVFGFWCLNWSNADRGSTINTWDDRLDGGSSEYILGVNQFQMTFLLKEIAQASGNVRWFGIIQLEAVLPLFCSTINWEYWSSPLIRHDNIGYADLSDFFFCWMKAVMR
jgi:putative DNA methylase